MQDGLHALTGSVFREKKVKERERQRKKKLIHLPLVDFTISILRVKSAEHATTEKKNVIDIIM